MSTPFSKMYKFATIVTLRIPLLCLVEQIYAQVKDLGIFNIGFPEDFPYWWPLILSSGHLVPTSLARNMWHDAACLQNNPIHLRSCLRRILIFVCILYCMWIKILALVQSEKAWVICAVTASNQFSRRFHGLVLQKACTLTPHLWGLGLDSWTWTHQCW